MAWTKAKHRNHNEKTRRLVQSRKRSMLISHSSSVALQTLFHSQKNIHFEAAVCYKFGLEVYVYTCMMHNEESLLSEVGPEVTTAALSDWFTPLLAIVVIALVYLILNRRRPSNYPPGPKSLPLIGNLHQLGTRPFVKFMAMKKEYGGIMAIDFASYRGVVLNDAKLIREALAMPEFCGRPKLRPLLERFNDGKFRGIATNEGDSAVQQRRFAAKNLRDFGMGKNSMETLIQEEMDELMKTLTKLDGKPFQTKYVFNLAAVNSLWWIIVGERFQHDDPRLQTLVKLLTDALMDSTVAGAFFFFPWLSKLAPELMGYNKFMSFNHNALDLIQNKLQEQKATFESGHHRHFLDFFIQEVVDCKDPESAFYGEEGERNLVASVVDLFMAGIETSSTTMSWIVMFLALHPEVQDKILEEIRRISTRGQPLTLDDQQRMPYIQAFITEVFRYSSILPLGLFHCTTENVVFHGYSIPKDTMIVANLHGVHHDPEVWGDPDTFRPERFITAEGTFAKPGESFLPFSTGKRSCIGESLARNTLFIFVATFCLRFKVLPNPSKPRPVIDYSTGIVMQPKPYEYVLQPRQAS